MKRVAITQRLETEPRHGEVRNSLDIRWSSFLSDCNLVPCPLPIGLGLEEYIKDDVSGIIFTGGGDLSSTIPSGSAEYRLAKLRDKHEKRLMDIAIEKSIPVIGVCRGMQLIAEYFGSTLKIVDKHVATRHPIEVQKSGEYYEHLCEVKSVNSYHSFGIDQLASCLESNAICPEDDVIEFIAHKEKAIVGIMWHPERETNPSCFDKSLFLKMFYSRTL